MAQRNPTRANIPNDARLTQEPQELVVRRRIDNLNHGFVANT